MSGQATGQQVIPMPVNTKVFAYDEKTRQEVFVNFAMASVPRAGELVQFGGKRYEVKQVEWLPAEHKAVLALRAMGA